MVIFLQLLLKEVLDTREEAVGRVYLADGAPFMQLLHSHLLAVDENVVCAMDTNAMRQRANGTVLGHEGQGRERCLDVAAIRRKNGIREAEEPGCAAANSRSVEAEDEDFTVVNDCADQLDTYDGVSTGKVSPWVGTKVVNPAYRQTDDVSAQSWNLHQFQMDRMEKCRHLNTTSYVSCCAATGPCAMQRRLTFHVPSCGKKSAFASQDCEYRVRVLIQLAKSIDCFWKNSVAKGVQKLGSIELRSVSCRIDSIAVRSPDLDDADLPGHLYNDIFIIGSDHFAAILINAK